MTKQQWLGLVLGILLLLGVCTGAYASDNPIVCSVDIQPNKLVGPGTVDVTVTVSNSGNTDMTNPVVLYDPNAQIISDFGTNGEAILKAGQTVTWQGKYDVNQLTLDNGYVMYFVKYDLLKDDGSTVATSQSIRGTVEMQKASVDLEVSRTISPTVAKEGQKVTVTYLISNTGTIAIQNLTIAEHEDVHGEKQTIPLLEPGQTAKIAYPVTMGTENLTSGAAITYFGEGDKEMLTYTIEDMAIVHGEPAIEATLSADIKSVMIGEKVMLTLTLENTGDVDLSDVRVNDDTLGEVFSNQKVDAGETLTLEKEITLTQTTDYLFNVTAVDSSGAETMISTDSLQVVAVDPEDVLTLDLKLTSDRTEVFETPGVVRFSLVIENNSGVDAKKVVVKHGSQNIYEFETIPAGESRTLTRDTALSMAGKYQFTATTVDALEQELSFVSNEIQVAFSVPTPAPVTPTPAPDPTPVPTFYALTMPPITDASIGAIPKLIQNILLPLLIVAGVVMFASIGLLIYATIKRRKAQKASEEAVDHLDRAKRRNYAMEGQPEEPEEIAVPVNESTDADNDEWDALELPHQQYARSAMKTSAEMRSPQAEENSAQEDTQGAFSAMNQSFYDEEMRSDWSAPSKENVPMAFAPTENEETWPSYDPSLQGDDGASFPQESYEDYYGEESTETGYAPYDAGLVDPYAPYDAEQGADPYAPYDAGQGADPYAPYDAEQSVDPYAPYDGYQEEAGQPYFETPVDSQENFSEFNTGRSRRLRSDR